MKTVLHTLQPTLVLLLLLSVFMLPMSASSQSELEKALQQYNATTVQGYIQPVADLFGANMQAGFYHSAAIPRGVHFGLDLVAMGSLVSDGQKSYDVTLPPGFILAPGASRSSATIFGGKGTTFVDSRGFSTKGSDGIINTSIFPLAAPQLTIGLYGTQLKLRLIATPSIGDGKFPSTTLLGLGARHDIGQYIPSCPLDVAEGVFYSSFRVGDIITFKGIAIGAQASKTISILTMYGGLAWEKSTLSLSYTSTDISANPLVDTSFDGANTFRFTLGVSLFGFLFVDANFGSVTNFSGGIGFQI